MPFIKKVQSNKKTYYYIVESYREGHKTKHRVLKKLNSEQILSKEELERELASFKQDHQNEIHHQVKQAVILAAGKAPRLYPFSTSRPVALLEVGGIPFIEHAMKNLLALGIKTIFIVTGFQAYQFEELGKKYRRNVRLVFNPFFDLAGSLVSFWIAKDLLKGAFVSIYGDVAFGKEHLRKLLEDKADIVLTSLSSEPDYEAERVRSSHGQVLALSTNVPDNKTSGEFTGLVKFSKIGLKNMLKALKQLEREENFTRLAFPALIERLVNLDYAIKDLRIEDKIWIDIDIPEELKEARRKLTKLERNKEELP
jgi:choline kinase